MDNIKKTRDDLLAEARVNPTALAIADQIDASFLDVIAVAPENQGKASNRGVSQAIQRALSSRAFQGPPRGAVVRLHETDPSQGSAEFDRPVGDFALPQTAVAPRCNICNQSYAHMIAFWYPSGSVIVQVDACPDCAAPLIGYGHKPRVRA